jgi:hypothetical protein
MKCHCNQIDGNVSFSSALVRCVAFIVVILGWRGKKLCRLVRGALAWVQKRYRIVRSDPLIDILHADDVVLAAIRAGLDLNQIERHLSGISEAVHATERMDRLV